MKKILVMISLALILGACAGSGLSVLPLPGKAFFPEGIAAHPDHPYLYVGSTTDGTILKVHPLTGETNVFSLAGADGRTKAVGLHLDDEGRLWVAGGESGDVYVYSLENASLIRRYQTGSGGFINDVVVSSQGIAYITDSFRPYLYRIVSVSEQPTDLKPWLDFSEAGIYTADTFNINGVAVSASGDYVVLIHSFRGELIVVNATNGDFYKSPVLPRYLLSGDGLWLDGQDLYVSQNRKQSISHFVFIDDSTPRFSYQGSFTSPLFAFNTTLVRKGKHLYVVNGQLDKKRTAPELPFTIQRVSLPLEYTTSILD